MIRRTDRQLPADFNEFLLEAHSHGYAEQQGENTRLLLANGSHHISYVREPYSYTDIWVGGTPFSGMEHISRRSDEVYQPLWAMIYRQTFWDKTLLPEEELADVLNTVLAQPNPQLPLRGPKSWEKNAKVYWTRPVTSGSNLDNFDIEEFINKNGQRVYTARFMGGIVDQNNVTLD